MNRVKLDPNLEKNLSDTDGFHETQIAAANSIVTAAQAVAPVHTHHYRDSLHVVEADGIVAAATSDIAGSIIEYGSVNNPPYAPIRRGTRAAGLRLSEDQ